MAAVVVVKTARQLMNSHLMVIHLKGAAGSAAASQPVDATEFCTPVNTRCARTCCRRRLGSRPILCELKHAMLHATLPFISHGVRRALTFVQPSLSACDLAL